MKGAKILVQISDEGAWLHQWFLLMLVFSNSLKKFFSFQLYTQRYYPGYTLAQRLGINTHFLSRITGSIYIKKGSPDNSEGNANIGLNLKFTKRNEEVPGYTKLADNGWTYSDKAMETIGEYLRK